MVASGFHDVGENISVCSFPLQELGFAFRPSYSHVKRQHCPKHIDGQW